MSGITVLGAGAWGTALAITLARSGYAVTLAVRRQAHLDSIARDRVNSTYLSGVPFPPTLRPAAMESEVIAGAEIVVMAVPSRFARAVLTPLAAAIPPDATVVSVTKGIEQDSLRTMSQMLTELAPPASRVAVLSGPGFAAEIARGKPAALVSAGRDENVARRVQTLFAAKPLRIYRSADVIGIELGGAVKNVIAIAAGISDGLGLGSGARAALITRGLAEMMRLATAAGAERETLAGLAGLGDLVLTCTGDLSRNRSLGLTIGRGEPRPVPSAGESFAEGVPNTSAIRRLAESLKVEMPIVTAVYRILYEGAPANAMVDELVSRELKAEF
ncbi:MAG TPA: NAD(P)H-dependent glycerol-3-phosphate dehydrogenase [Candidatus Binataceae bacterium]|nr:NAD(P)H-dependent glycerol-3-phosphate dehydrogenase [Candidatus Binataceae bacterium]